LAQLASALQSGNLGAAQQAYSSLASLTQSLSTAQATIQLSPEFSTLGQALQSGNLSAAQQAFSVLQQDPVRASGALGSPRDLGGTLQISANSDNSSDSILISHLATTAAIATANSNGASPVASYQTNTAANFVDLMA